MQLRFLDWFRGFGLGFLVAAARGSLRTLIFGEEFNQSIWILFFFGRPKSIEGWGEDLLEF